MSCLSHRVNKLEASCAHWHWFFPTGRTGSIEASFVCFSEHRLVDYNTTLEDIPDVLRDRRGQGRRLDLIFESSLASNATLF